MNRKKKLSDLMRVVSIIILVALFVNALIPRKIFKGLEKRNIFHISIENFNESMEEYVFLENKISSDLQSNDDVFSDIKEVIANIEGKPRINVFGLKPSDKIETSNWGIVSLFSATANQSNTDMVLSITHYPVHFNYQNDPQPLPFEIINIYLGDNSLAVKSEVYFTKYKISNGEYLKERIIQILRQHSDAVS